ncbi:hypothetical protein VTN00DRAFT_4233 [Thermoascus crustaceus]|uniref:uncharacterized protein n=1 Tax=Thermoascus crustaceus TaxID=5088 RepID=UPI003744A039
MTPRTNPNPDDDHHSDAESSPLTLSRTLLHQCRLILSELDAFQTLVSCSLRRPQLVEIRQLRSNVVSEMRMLEKLERQAAATSPGGDNGEGKDGEGDDEEESSLRLIHALRSSNLPFYAAVWTIAKRSCEGLVAFGKRFYWDEGRHAKDSDEAAAKRREDRKQRAGMDKRKSVLVDIVADEGEEWVKVSTVSESRLLFEMAKKGWERGEESVTEEDEEEYDEDGQRRKRTILQNYGSDGEESDDEDDEIELVKLAADMRKASRATRVRYRHPRVRFVIPKIMEGRVPEIDDILNEIRGYGVTVECGTSVPDVMTGEIDQGRDPSSVTPEELNIAHLLPNPYKRFTPTLNVDCTLLLALVSDLSHFRNIPPLPNHHQAIHKQIKLEEQQPLVPTELWPAMDGRELLCTKEAARRMREIVDTIGTDTERKRTEMLMGDPEYQGLDREALIQKFQELSDHQVPAQWKIPVKVIDAEADISAGWQIGRLRGPAHKVQEILSDINRSVFLYGWATGMVTISSNRTVVRQIEHTIEENRNGDEELEGPLVWVCDTARSLVGKEKNRR